ncbi:MAG: peptide ABC transporter substrate-binding protein, partial [Chloroflexota bacterium]
EGNSLRGQGKTLTFFNQQSPTTLNPHLSPGSKDLMAARITYEPLATFNKEGILIPFLAADIPSIENGGLAEDGLSVTWQLKQNVFWSDGEPFTADDVLFTFEYITNPEVNSTSAAVYNKIDNIEILDDHSLKINFKLPTPTWFDPFVGAFGMVIPRHIFSPYNGANYADASANINAVGTGPFRVKEYLKEDILIIGTSAVNTITVIYEINPYFRNPDKPFFKEVIVRSGGDVETAGLAFKEGIFDYAYSLGLTTEGYREMESTGKAKLIPALTSFTERIMLNFSDPNQETTDGERSSIQYPHPFLSSKEVREAISLAINREAILEFWGSTAVPTSNILVQPPGVNSPNTSFEYNPQKAIELLDTAGWVDSDNDGIRDKDGVKLEILYQTSIEPLRQLTQDQVKQDLEAIGFKIDLKQIDPSIYFGPTANTTDTRRHFYADFEEFAFNNKSPDPTVYMTGWTCDAIAQKENDWSLTNWSRYCNPEYDAVFEKLNSEFDPEKRAELFIQLNDILISDFAVIPLVHRYFGNVEAVNLHGPDISPWDVDTWNIVDWTKE